MDKAIGASMVVIGALTLWGAVHLWHAKSDKNKGWKEAVAIMVVIAGLLLGAGVTAFFGLNFLYIKVGFIDLWIILAAVSGIWFLVDLLGRHGWTRTPVLGLMTAVFIAIPAAGPVLSHVNHGHAPQVTSVIKKH